MRTRSKPCAIASTIAGLHEPGIVDGDLMPSNFVIALWGDIAMIEFESAREVGCKIRPSLCHTALNDSWEIGQEGSSLRSNVWALGLTLSARAEGTPGRFAEKSDATSPNAGWVNVCQA
jgi:serine/threonine protein kinase